MAQSDAIRENKERPIVLLSAEDIRAQLKRIETSPDFAVPERAHKFLCYVVEEALEGRAERIKAYSIAIEVFGRDSSFDAQSDPAVRIEASRLRRALERYYLTAGQTDPLLITIPKGGYVPLFAPRNETPDPLHIEPASNESRGADPAPATSDARLPRPFPSWGWIVLAALAALTIGTPALRWIGVEATPQSRAIDADSIAPGVPRLLVESFEDLTGSEDLAILARGLTEEVIGKLAKFKELVVVVARNDSPIASGEIPGSGRAGTPRYALTGNIRVADDLVRLSVKLLNTEDGSVLWANTYDEKLMVGELLDAESDVARNITTALAQPYGIVFQAEASRVLPAPPDDWEAYRCTLYFYTYQAELGPQTHASAQACLLRTVERFPSYATAWALLSLSYLDEFRFKYTIKSTGAPPLDEALRTALRAVDLDNQNIRALEAQMVALFLKGDVEAALKVGARAFMINPNDTEFLAEYGLRLGLSGEWKRGGDLIAEALARNPGPLGLYQASMAMCLFMQGQYGPAAVLVRSGNVQSNPLYHFIAAAVFAASGATAEAARERAWLEANAQNFIENIRHEIEIRIVRPEDQAHFVDGLRKAGLQIQSDGPNERNIGAAGGLC